MKILIFEKELDLISTFDISKYNDSIEGRYRGVSKEKLFNCLTVVPKMLKEISYGDFKKRASSPHPSNVRMVGGTNS